MHHSHLSLRASPLRFALPLGGLQHFCREWVTASRITPQHACAGHTA